MTGMRRRSIATFLVLFLASSCDRLIGADFDRNGALDAGGDTTAGRKDSGDASDGGDTADADEDVGDAPDDGSQDDGGDAGEAGDAGDADDGPSIPDASDGGDAGDAGPDPSDANDGGPGDVRPDLGEPTVAPTLYVAATTDNKGLWLFALPAGSLGDVTSNAAPPVDVLAQAGAVGFVDDVEIQTVGREVFVLGRVGSNTHIASVRGDTWKPWQPVATDVNAMALANVDGYLWACLVGGNGRLRLMSRSDDGAWQDHGDVMTAASIPGGDAPTGLIKVDCTGIGNDLEVFAIDAVNHVWNATRTAHGWSPFRRDLEAGDTGFVDVDTCNAAGDLHVMISETTKQWHKSRAPNGSWSGYGDIEYQARDPMGDVVAGAQASLYTEVEWLQLNSVGEIWISTRFRCCPTDYQRLAGAAPSGRPFVSLSATGVLPF
jgi:hypothetical protein